MQLETQKIADLYQNIAVTVNEIIPEEWSKVLIYAEVQEDVSKVGFYYYPEREGNPVFVLEIPELFEVDEDHIDQLRHELSGCFEELWKEYAQENQDIWTSLTFILDATGQFKIDFEYEDLSEVDDFERQIIWRYKYLGLEPPLEKKRARQIFESYIESTQDNHQ